MVHQISKTECHIEYHEQTLSGSVVTYRMETIQVVYRIEKTCLLPFKSLHSGQLCQLQQTDIEEQWFCKGSFHVFWENIQR